MPDLKIYICPFCGARFATPVERQSHIMEFKPNYVNRCRLAGGRLFLERLNEDLDDMIDRLEKQERI